MTVWVTGNKSTKTRLLTGNKSTRTKILTELFKDTLGGSNTGQKNSQWMWPVESVYKQCNAVRSSCQL